MTLRPEDAAPCERLKWLHDLFVTRGDYGNDWSDVVNATICDEARSAIERLVRENQAMREALQRECDIIEASMRGSTHWEGCEKQHPKCAALVRMRAAISAGGQEGT